jgi:aryl-alcohol dehydrogenase-like predicted oxidoreductase
VEPYAEGRRAWLTPEYSISRIIVGGWQFSRGHGGGTPGGGIPGGGTPGGGSPGGGTPGDFLAKLVDQGCTAFDCADIYTGVEEMLGDFLRQQRGSDQATSIQIHTKFVPDLDVLPTIDRPYVERIIHRSLSRLGVDALDLVQFHWWDFSVPGYVEVMGWLGAMKQAGKIRHLGVTNFDEVHLAELVDSGAEIVSNQVQYSALDRRPAMALAPYCLQHGISLLCYGALAGGFLTDRYLGMGEPPRELENRSLVKYRLMIDEIGGWSRYQALLRAMHRTAARAEAPLAAVALRYVLDRPGVAATITGMDTLPHARELLAALDVRLDTTATDDMEDILSEIPMPPGPVYGLERIVDGPHGAIMRYNLNRE